MKLRRVLAFAVVFVLLGSVGFGESKRRTVKGSVGPVAVTGVAVADCGDFQVLADWVALITWTDVLDKDGQWVRSSQHYTVLGESLYYNSEDPDRAVVGGPGENENSNWDAATGVVSFHGLMWKIRVPGHGVLWFETGSLVQQCEPYTFQNCEAVSNTGHNMVHDGDIEALCEYLR